MFYFLDREKKIFDSKYFIVHSSFLGDKNE